MSTKHWFILIAAVAASACQVGNDPCTKAQQHVLDCGIKPDKVKADLSSICDEDMANMSELVAQVHCSKLRDSNISFDEGKAQGNGTDWLDWIGIGAFNSCNSLTGGWCNGFKDTWDGFANWRKGDGKKAWNDAWASTGKAFSDAWAGFTNPKNWQDAFKSTWDFLGGAKVNVGWGFKRFGDFLTNTYDYLKWPAKITTDGEFGGEGGGKGNKLEDIIKGHTMDMKDWVISMTKGVESQLEWHP